MARDVVAVTARVTTLKGADAGAYYVEALPSYYLDADEPRGRWHGRGAELLGLEGEVVDDEFLRLMAGLDPHAAVGAHLGRPFAEGSVRGFDVTASAPKSVSTLFAVGDEATRAAALEAHDTAVDVAIRWIEVHAHTRYRINGEVAVVDAVGIVAASFRQHTSRALDPQLHTHVVIANRVRSPDGRWLALDARGLKLDQRTVSAIYHSALRSELTARLGVEWQLVANGIAEIAHMPEQVLEEFSSRTADVQRRLDVKLGRFEDTFGRAPTARERWRLEREAVVDSRPGKRHDTDAASLHAGWVGRVEALGVDPERLVEAATGRCRARRIDRRTGEEAMVQAVEALSEKQSTWRPAELTREIAAALPTDLHVPPDLLVDLLDDLTRTAIGTYCVDLSRPVPEGAVLRRDGRPVNESVADRLLTTPAILAQEERLMAWAERRMTSDAIDSAAAVERAEVELSVPQAETAAAVAGTADLVLVVGPAGTGKTTALAPAVEQLQADGRVVFGVAPSAAAADVLAAETGVAADTLDKLLTEHGLERPPDHRFDLPLGATVIVDEAAMASTDRLDRLARLADSRGWRVVLVGDPMQFTAVGRGGMFDHLVDTCGAIELDRVHRFTNAWERDASLRLRRGDPTVAEVYEHHGHLHGGTATRVERNALDAWWSARMNGETVLLAAPTNETVRRVNAAAQQRRIAVGEINPNGRHAEAAGYQVWPGDEVASRQNLRRLRTDRGMMIANRDRWSVEAVHRNGDLTVTGATGRVRLPAAYVREHVELAYAQTSHATQGRTVDRSILVLDQPTDVRGVYVAMTRGRHHNDAYIVTTDEQTPVDVFTQAITRNWIDQPAHARQAALHGENARRPGTLSAGELRRLFEQRADLTGRLESLRSDLRLLPADIRRTQGDHDNAVARLERQRAALRQAHDTLAAYDRPFRRRGHEPDIAAARRSADVLPGLIDSTATERDGLAGQLRRLERRLDGARHLDTQRPAWETELVDVDERLDDDSTIRGRQLRRDPLTHIVDALGARPAAGRPGDAWDRAAGRYDQHDTAFNSDHGFGAKRLSDYSSAFVNSRSRADASQRVLRSTLSRRHRLTPEPGDPHHGISL